MLRGTNEWYYIVSHRIRVDADSLCSNNSEFKENSKRSMGARKL
jgi:hypothetical protein